jgi:hypothetical protein
MFDLLGVANVLGVLEADEDAAEVVGMDEKLVAELGGSEATGAHLVGTEAIDAARERLGPAAAALCTSRATRSRRAGGSRVRASLPAHGSRSAPPTASSTWLDATAIDARSRPSS